MAKHTVYQDYAGMYGMIMIQYFFQYRFWQNELLIDIYILKVDLAVKKKHIKIMKKRRKTRLESFKDPDVKYVNRQKKHFLLYFFVQLTGGKM